MSQENVEVVRRFYRRGVFPIDPQRLLDDCDPHGDYYPVEKFPEARPCHGVKEIERFLRDYQQAWDHVDMTITAITPVRDDRVLVRAMMVGEGRESGIRLEGELFQCYWLRHGRIFRQEDHLTEKGALHALGLSGETLEAAGLSE
jgi:hypothetical protein